MKNKVKSLFGILLAMLMVFTVTTPAVAEAAGQQGENTKQTVTVRLSAQQENTFFMMPQEYTVSSDKAEEYGFTDKEGVVTALDALVAAHEYVFQDAFTKETKDEFLKVNENGWISAMFGTETGNMAFAVNGICPHDDVLTDYGSYTGYTVIDSELKPEDDVEFFFYQDSELYLDNYAWFENNGNKVTELDVMEGTPVELILKGYCYCYYNCYPEETILERTGPVEEAQIMVLDENGNRKDLSGYITDQNGTVILDNLSKGIYYISAYTDVENDDTPMTSPVCRVTVAGRVTIAERMDKLLTGISASYTDTTDSWKIMEMVKFGKRDALTKLSEYEESAKQAIVKEGSSATDIEKAIIVLSALGYDASELTINGEKINAIEKMFACNLNSANANVFALCALDSGQYYLPKDSTVTRESLVRSLLDRRTADKGWTFFGSNADADMTSMAVQSLAPYYLAANAKEAELSEVTYNAVKSAVEEALTCLSNMQKNDGTYSNANSSAMVLMSLASVGVDGDTDVRFIKDGKSVLNGIMEFALEDNSGFGYTNNTSLNAMATEQGFRALVSYSKFKETKRAYNIYLSGSLDIPEIPIESVEISEKEKLIYKGNTGKLTVRINPSDATNKNVTWTSSNTSVATVDTEGMVTAKSEGTAVITAMAQGDNSKTAICVITVKEQPKEETPNCTEENKNTGTEQNTEHNTEQSTQQVTKKPVIKLNYSSLSLQKGKSTKAVKIKSSSPSGERISFAVSDKKNVAAVAVNKGVIKITGKKTGTATITVTSTGGATAKIKITVKKKVNVKKLKLNKKNITLKKGKKFTLTVSKNPVTATNKIKWSSSNKKVATVNSKGVVKAKKKGKATIMVKASNGKKTTCKITVK